MAFLLYGVPVTHLDNNKILALNIQGANARLPPAPWKDPTASWKDPVASWKDPMASWKDPTASWKHPTAFWKDPTETEQIHNIINKVDVLNTNAPHPTNAIASMESRVP